MIVDIFPTSIQVRTRRHKRRNGSIGKIVLLLLIGVIGIYFLYSFWSNTKELVSPYVPAKVSDQKMFSVQSQNHSSLLKITVNKALEGTKGSYAMVIKNFKTGESYYSNEHKKYEAGSLYKLWVMATAFHQFQKGQLQEDEVLSEDIKTLNRKFYIDDEVAELTDGVITLTVASSINQMITISHNYAALLLTERLKLSNVKSFLEQSGFFESTIGTKGEFPTTTASDVALFLDKLYNGKLVNTENTEKIIALLKKQQINDKLPKYLPKDVAVAHKTGEFGFFSHDAGIIYSPKGDYIIVVLSESSSPIGADERIAEVSKNVYDYFVN